MRHTSGVHYIFVQNGSGKKDFIKWYKYLK